MSRGLCIVCGVRYGKAHLPVCPRFIPDTLEEKEIKQLEREIEAIKAEAENRRQQVDSWQVSHGKQVKRAEKAEAERDRLRDLVEEAYAEGWGDNQPSANVAPMNNMDDMWTGSDSLAALNHKEG